MIKNKDGSYNKFSVLIILLIGVIGIGVIGSTLNIDITTIEIIGGIISVSFIIYFGVKILFKSKSDPSHQPHKIETIQIPQPVKESVIKQKCDVEIKPSMGFLSLTHIVSLIITVIIGVVGLVVASSLVNSMGEVLKETSNSALSTPMKNVSDTVNASFNFLSIGFIIITTIFIIGIFSNIVPRCDYD